MLTGLPLRHLWGRVRLGVVVAVVATDERPALLGLLVALVGIRAGTLDQRLGIIQIAVDGFDRVPNSVFLAGR